MVRGDLLEKWQDISQSDSTRIASISLLIRRYRRFSNDSCLVLLKELVRFCYQTNNDSCIIHGNILLHTTNPNIRGKDTVLDSLETLRPLLPLRSAPDKEAEYYRMLVGAFTRYHQLDSASQYLDKAMQLSKSTKDSIGIARAHMMGARISMLETKLDRADQQFRKASEISTALADTFTILSIENEYLRFLVNHGKYNRAREKAGAILKLLEDDKSKYARSYARVKMRLATIARFEGDYVSSMRIYLETLDFCERESQKEMIVHLKGNIAMVYEQMEDYENAARYAEETMQHFKEVDDTANLLTSMMHLGYVLYQANPQDTMSQHHIKQAYKLAEKLGDQFSMDACQLYRSQYFIENDQLDVGQDILNSIRSNLQFHPIKEVSMEFQVTDLRLLQKQGRCSEAMKVALSALELEGLPSEIEHKQTLYSALYECAKSEGDDLLAFQYLEQYNAVTDSINAEKKQMQFARLNLQHTLAKEQTADSLAFAAEQSILQQQLSNTRFQTKAFAFGGGLFLLLSLLILQQYRKVRKGRKKTEQLLLSEKAHSDALMKEQARVQLKSLTRQMDPHFMFNSLQSISNYVSENDSESANRYLARFAQLMRQSLNYSQVDKISLEDELELLETYLELERLRFGHQFEFEIEVDDRLDLYDIAIPPMFIQPHVENAVWHGIRHRIAEPGARVLLKFDKSEEYLVVNIIDNGIGRRRSQEINQGERPGHQSVGTKNMLKRRELINQLYSRPLQMASFDHGNADSAHVGTRIEIQFPI